MSWSQFNTFQTKNYRSDLPSMCRVVSSLLLVVSEREKSLIKCEKGIFSLFDLNSTNQEPIECIPIKDLVKYQAHFTQFFLCNKEPTKILCLWIHQIGLFWFFFPKVRTGQNSYTEGLCHEWTSSENVSFKVAFFFSSSRNIILVKKYNII